jgi:hypothetical protein
MPVSMLKEVENRAGAAAITVSSSTAQCAFE